MLNKGSAGYGFYIIKLYRVFYDSLFNIFFIVIKAKNLLAFVMQLLFLYELEC